MAPPAPHGFVREGKREIKLQGAIAYIPFGTVPLRAVDRAVVRALPKNLLPPFQITFHFGNSRYVIVLYI